MDAVLVKALNYARRKKFAQAIQILNNEVHYYRGSWEFTYIMGLCYLRGGDIGSAAPLFKRAAEQERAAAPVLALAAVHLRRGENDKAISCYLNALDIEPGCRLARRALDMLRRSPGLGGRDSKNIAALYPPFPRPPFSIRAAAKTCAAFLVILAVSASAVLLGRGLKNGSIKVPALFVEKAAREGFAASALSSEEKSASAGSPTGAVRYILTNKEINDCYEKGRWLFNAKRDDASRVEMNRILESNAAEAVKNKAHILISYMAQSDFTSLKDFFTYEEVSADPFLYRDCAVRWRGMAVNLETADTRTAFDFLAGYDPKKNTVVKGIVPVIFDYAVPVNTEKPLETLGAVLPLAAGGFSLRGIAIHELQE